jgi:ribosomal protein L7/L12
MKMLNYDAVSAAAMHKVGVASLVEMNVTQHTIYNMFVEFGLEIARKADQEQANTIERPKATFEDIRAYLRAGQKINAIKLFRELTGACLKDAKDQVDLIKLDGF